jgi:hypothetical protein
MKLNLYTVLLTAISLMAVPAMAQQNNNNQANSERQRQRQNSERQRQQQTDKQKSGNQGDQRSQAQNKKQLVPVGWVSVAVDYDNDNKFDGYETIYYYDLVDARNKSWQRRGPRSAHEEARTISGEISNLKSVNLSDGDEHRLAKIETEQGNTVRVDLGRTKKVQQLQLSDGDSVTIKARPARLNDKAMWVATSINSGGKSLSIERKDDRGLKRMQGTIEDMQTMDFKNKDGEFSIATVKTNGDKEKKVILGQTNKLNKLNLSQGDEVQLLVRRGRMNNEEICIAEQVRANGQMVQTPRPKGQKVRPADRNRQNDDGRKNNRESDDG